MSEPTIIEMIAELKAAGWKKAKPAWIWKSPQGTLHLGPYGAWKAMKLMEDYYARAS